MFCPECGKEIPDNAAFCKYCGTKLSVGESAVVNEAAQVGEADAANDSASTSEAPAPSDAAAPNEAVAGAVASAGVAAGAVAGEQAAATPITPVAATPQRKKNGKIILGVAAAAVVAVVAAVVYAVFLSPYNIDSNTFPDETLRTAITKGYDSDHDGKLSRDEAKNVTKLDLTDSEIEDLKGIELLPNLRTLNLSGCKYLETLDVSKNGNLENLAINGTSVESLDLSHNRAIKTLDATGSSLASVNISGCENLKSAAFNLTKLTELDISGAKSLEALEVNSEVDVTGIEGTNLREQWLITEATITGAHSVAVPNMGSIGNNSTDVYNFTYNNENQLTWHARQSVNPSMSYLNYDTYTYTYGDAGQVTWVDKSSSSTNSRGYTSYNATTYGFAYDDNGLLNMYTSKYNSGSMTRYYYSYDKNGRQETSDSYRFSYNDAGKLVGVSSKSSGKSYMTISYNDAGAVEKITFDGNSTYYSFEYDVSGRCTTRHYVSGDTPSLNYDVVFTYGDTGKVSQAQTISSDGSVVGTATYEYDSNGNLVKRTIENPTFPANTNYNTGLATYKYSRVFTKSDAGVLPSVFINMTGVDGYEGVIVPFNQKFAADEVFAQTGTMYYLSGRPYMH